MKETLSNRHEREYAATMPNTTQTLASGAILEKHDGRSEYTLDNVYWRFRSELKCTQRKSYSFKVQDWLDLVEYAALQGERPLWSTRFYDPDPVYDVGNTPVLADLVTMDKNDYIEMQDELTDLRRRLAAEEGA